MPVALAGSVKVLSAYQKPVKPPSVPSGTKVPLLKPLLVRLISPAPLALTCNAVAADAPAPVTFHDAALPLVPRVTVAANANFGAMVISTRRAKVPHLLIDIHP